MNFQRAGYEVVMAGTRQPDQGAHDIVASATQRIEDVGTDLTDGCSPEGLGSKNLAYHEVNEKMC